MPMTRSTRTLTTEAARAARQWYVADADGQVLGRLATRVANVLRGKHNPGFSPHLDAGDFVVVVNAEKIRLTGNKLQEKQYIRHSEYPGGLRRATAAQVLAKHPTRVVYEAVVGMLPKNRLGRKLATHQAQRPLPLS
jgi:large subunit ribosomal protein L13